MIRSGAAYSILLIIALTSPPVQAGVFLLDTEAREDSPGAVSHPIGYDGSGGTLTVSLCIDPSSPHADELVAPTEKAIATLNARVPTINNYVSQGNSTEVPADHLDAESIILHEALHCLGLHHGNLQSNLSAAQALFFGDATFATKGPDGEFSFDFIGADNIWGSADDYRDDDINMFWFQIMNNDPFAIPGGASIPAYDQTGYTRDTGSLPLGNDFPANGTPKVAQALGYSNTKAIMYSLTGTKAEARSLSHDDAMMLRYAMSGLNEIAGDADDYVLSLELGAYPCEIPIRLVSLGSEVAGRCPYSIDGPIIGSTDHYTVIPTGVLLNADQPWYFGSALDLAITITDNDAVFLPGGNIVYTLEVSNVGSGVDASGVEIEEMVPENTTFNATESDPAWACDGIVAGSACILPVGLLTAGGASAQATFAVTVDSPLQAEVEEIFNLARVSDDGANGPDPNVGNDSAQDSTPIDPDLIFGDGFESGDLLFWSGTEP